MFTFGLLYYRNIAGGHMDTEGYRMDHVIEMKNVSRSFHDKKR